MAYESKLSRELKNVRPNKDLARLKRYKKALQKIVELPDLIDNPMDSDPGDTISQMQQIANKALSIK